VSGAPIELLSRASADRTVSPEELVFETPWSARLFGLTLALIRAGHFSVHEFQQSMITEIRAYEVMGCIDSNATYYERWIEALLALLRRKGTIADGALAAMEARVRAATPPRHTHDHDHHHAPQPIAVSR
jgi:nitrile hydratase accessory protein